MYTKKEFKRILLGASLMYFVSLVVFGGLQYIMDKGNHSMFNTLTKVDYKSCEYNNPKLAKAEESCIKQQKAIEESLQSEAYDKYKNSAALNKYFLFVTKSDSIEANNLSYDFLIETLDENSDQYETAKKNIDDLRAPVAESIAEIWFYLYLFLNPLIPLAFSIFEFHMIRIVKRMCQKFEKNRN